MKRFFSMLFVFAMLLSLCACTVEPQVTEPSEDHSACLAGHTWKDANCFFPKTCSVCGVTDGESNDHSWKDSACTLCGMVNAQDDPLITGTWMYITKQGWDVIEFLPDGTCEIRKIYGMPKAATTAEECAEAAMETVKRQFKENWETVAKQRFFIFKILDYYYCCEMTAQAVEYTVDGSMIVLEQEGFVPQRLLMVGRGKIVDEIDGKSYINLSCTYHGSLLDNYNTNH